MNFDCLGVTLVARLKDRVAELPVILLANQAMIYPYFQNRTYPFNSLLASYQSREHVTFAGPHPLAPSPKLGEGDPSHSKLLSQSGRKI